ncbi:MAG: MFS transporter [Candidatus Dormibacteria bacterium]
MAGAIASSAAGMGNRADIESSVPPSRLLLFALALGAFIGMVDATIAAVALGPLTAHFHLPLTAGQEVLSIYLVVITATLPTVGRLGDRFGRRGAYVAGFVIFGAGSILAAVTTSFGLLLTGRAIQAIGGGMLTAGSLSLIAEHVPRRRTGRSIALLVITQAIAGLVGPPVGGILVAAGGWQAVFWAGVPMAAVGMFATLRFVPVSATRRTIGLDVPGALLLAGFLLGLGAGISSLAGPVAGDIPAAAWFSIAWISLLLLVPAELLSRLPIVDRGLIRDRRFVGATAATFLTTGTLMSCFALLPFWLERAHGVSPIAAGAAFVPIGLGIAATSRHGGKLGDRGLTHRATTGGMALAAVGLSAAGVAARFDLWPLLLGGLFLLGCGNGLFSSPNTAAAIAIAPDTRLGSAAGFLSTARNAGVITGLGITGALYTAATSGVVEGTAADVAAAVIFTGAGVVCLAAAAMAGRIYRPRPFTVASQACSGPDRLSS